MALTKRRVLRPQKPPRLHLRQLPKSSAISELSFANPCLDSPVEAVMLALPVNLS
jgi:hypothetical protein